MVLEAENASGHIVAGREVGRGLGFALEDREIDLVTGRGLHLRALEALGREQDDPGAHHVATMCGNRN
jgi:hypothetical protein